MQKKKRSPKMEKPRDVAGDLEEDLPLRYTFHVVGMSSNQETNKQTVTEQHKYEDRLLVGWIPGT